MKRKNGMRNVLLVDIILLAALLIIAANASLFAGLPEQSRSEPLIAHLQTAQNPETAAVSNVSMPIRSTEPAAKNISNKSQGLESAELKSQSTTLNNTCSACSARPKPPKSEAFSSAPSTAAGYCNSYGGSHDFEYIKDISYAKNPSGTIAITVIIFIANPGGCTYGNPCPSYDSSPEHINGWIDWNGNGIFEEPNERVMNADLTGYAGISYYGYMAATSIVTIPGNAVSSPWMRINLGWGEDPNDPCAQSWAWGDVVDKQILVQSNTPKIDAIEISPQDPMTLTKDGVKLTAKIKQAGNYDITGYHWIIKDVKTGSETTGNTNPFTIYPGQGEYGNKEAELKILYKEKMTGATGSDVKSKSFRVFFEKGTVDKPADDDNDVNDPKNDKDGVIGTNWFEYWKKDGAVKGIENFEYDENHPEWLGYQAGGKLYLCQLASGEKSPFTVTLNDGKTETFFDKFDFKGINCAASTVAHESYHKRVYDKTEFPGIDLKDSDKWPGPDNTQVCWGQGKCSKIYNTGMYCFDGLPDEYETTTSNTNKTKPDTYNFANNWPKPADQNNINTIQLYAINGDQELMAFRKGSEKPAVDENKDWANPGKQTSTVYEPPLSVAKPLKVIPKQPPIESKIIGNYMDSATDSNGNGLFDNLKINFDVEVDKDGIYTLVGRLKDSSDQEIELTFSQFSLLAGVNNVELAFEGIKINNHGVNGPYKFSVGLYDWVGNWLDSQEDSYQTALYDYTNFEGQQAKLADGFTDTAEDSNGDGTFDNLKINVNVDVKVSGKYRVEGYLYGEGDNSIAFAKTEASLVEGLNEAGLTFSGTSIAFSEWKGRYRLRHLSLYDEFGTRLGFELDPYQTNEYDANDFKPTDVRFNEFTDTGQDSNGDGFFEYLVISSKVDVLKAGNYVIEGDLCDSAGNEIGKTSAEAYLDVGTRMVPLLFNGKSIYAHGISGTYKLANLLLYDESGTIKDSKKDAYTTSEYNYAAFQPLILLTGEYSDNGEDTNCNGLFDNLVVNVGVSVANSGNVIVKARLLDSDENEISWATNTAWIEAGGLRIIALRFDGRKIYTSGVDGPYVLRDLYIYHTGDPMLPDYVNEAYITSAYKYQEFESNPPNAPSMPSGPSSSSPGSCNSYSASATDPDGDQVKYTFDWGDGSIAVSCLVDSGTSASASHIWNTDGSYLVKAMAADSKDAASGWSEVLTVTISSNNPPNTPSIPSGPRFGMHGISCSYSTSAKDPDGDQVKYTFDWGDGTTTETKLVNSGAIGRASHIWLSGGTYMVKAMATDRKGAPSAWSPRLTVRML